MSLVSRGIKKISEIFHWIASAILALIFIMVVADVFARQTGLFTITDVGELSGLAVICLTFLGVPLALRQGRQIRVDLLTRTLSPRVQHILRIATDIVIVAWCLSMTWWGVDMVMKSQMMGLVSFMWRIPIWTVQIIVPVGMLFIALEALLEIVSLSKGEVQSANPSSH